MERNPKVFAMDIIDLCDSDSEPKDVNGDSRTSDQQNVASCIVSDPRRQQDEHHCSFKPTTCGYKSKSIALPIRKTSMTDSLIDLPNNSDSDDEDLFGSPFVKRSSILRQDDDSDMKQGGRTKIDHSAINKSIDIILENNLDGSNHQCDLLTEKQFSSKEKEVEMKATAKKQFDSSYQHNGRNSIIILSSDEDDNMANQKGPKKNTLKGFRGSQPKLSNHLASSDDDSIFSPAPFTRKKRSVPCSSEKKVQQSSKRGILSKLGSTSTSSRAAEFSTAISSDFELHSDCNDLLSPVPISNKSIAPRTILSPSKEIKKVPTPALPQIDTAKIGGKLYPDFRNEFIVALVKHSKRIRMITHQRRALDSCIQAIVKLSLYPYPIRTAYAASSIKGMNVLSEL